ncbi:MAG: (2Fe-2S)-binding protein [Lachnospiraceae bacterium]|nr:(2Fe-2S)-binding protein [Lachnospiraceae bacterium]
MIEVKFTLNGKETVVAVEPGETLLEMIRKRLNLTGTKRGCEVGECGACTVLIDGVPTDSCLYMAGQINGHDVMTIEGVATNTDLDVIQQAFIDNGSVQCGFCTPGLILSAYAFLKTHKHPTDDEIKRGLAGNFCRCATYVQVMDAIKDAAVRLYGEA